MGDNRRALVVASHWEAFESKPGARLENLEERARELRDLLLDPLRGACVPGWGDGLLSGPAVPEEVGTVLAEAFRDASTAGTALVLGFLGHGLVPGPGAFLFPVGATPVPPAPGTALDIPGELEKLLVRHGGVRELTVLLDACESGGAGLAAAEAWLPSALQTGRSIDILTSTDHGKAYGLKFTGALSRTMANGHVRLAEKIHPGPLRRLLGPGLVRQTPQSLSYGGGRGGHTELGGPWISKNVAFNAGLSVLATQRNKSLIGHLQHFEAPPGLSGLASAVGQQRCLVLSGSMGTGKTTLAAALCRLELLPDGAPPPPPMCALVGLSQPLTDDRAVARQLSEQLRDHLPGFAEALERYAAQASQEDGSAPPLDSLLLGPLGLMPERAPVRIVVDGLDQLLAQNRSAVVAALARLVASAPLWFGLVVTARDGVRLPPEWHRWSVPRTAGEEQLTGYLTARGLTAEQRRLVIRQAAGNWQIANVLAQRGPLDADRAVSYEDVYGERIDSARLGAPGGRGEWADAVLTVITASGLGAKLPHALLTAAAGRLDGPADAAGVDAVLDLFPGMVDRTPHPGAGELVGLQHQTLVEYVSARTDVDVLSGHAALATALGTMAPMEEHRPDDALHGYAEEAEPVHLWYAARRDAPLYARLLDSLNSRASAQAAVNRDRWGSWADRLTEAPPLEQEVMRTARERAALTALERAAYWTGKSGAYGQSRELYRKLLERQLLILPGDDPQVLESRSRIAYSAGETGDFDKAVTLHRDLLADQIRVFGPDDRRVLKTRHHIAYWIGRGGEMEKGLRLHEELLADQQRVLEPTDQDVLESRHYVAYWYGRLGRYREALAMNDRLLADRAAVFGEEHAQTVFSRMNICRFLGESGRLRECLDRYHELLPVVERVRGVDHPNTFLVRLNIARFTWERGDAEGSLVLHRELLEDQTRLLGAGHPSALITRYNIVMLRAELGDPAAALPELETLLAERRERYGRPDHAEVLTTRYGHAWVTGQAGDAAAGASAMRAVRADRARVLGPRHPDTLIAASACGDLLARAGGAERLTEAEDLLRETLTAQETALGERHPQCLTTRSRLADLLLRTGRGAEAAHELSALLPQQKEALGTGHPGTERTRRLLDGPRD